MRDISKNSFGLVYGLRRWLLGAIMILALAGGCKVTQLVPIETGTTVNVRDSIRWEIRDSIRIKEETRYKEWAGLLDTLSISSARGTQMRAWNDTTLGVLSGELREPELKEQTRIIYKDRWKVRDSIVFKEIPKIVEKPVEIIKIPWIFKFLSAVGLLSIIGLIIFLFVKIKRLR